MPVHPKHPWIDSSHAPVYHLTYPAYDSKDARQLASYSALHTALYAELRKWTAARRQAYGFTVDLSHVHSSAMSRQRAIQYQEQVRERGSPYMACRAYVTPNEAARGVITAVFWHSPPDFPHAFFGTIAEARKWALQQTLALDLRHARTTGS